MKLATHQALSEKATPARQRARDKTKRGPERRPFVGAHRDFVVASARQSSSWGCAWRITRHASTRHGLSGPHRSLIHRATYNNNATRKIIAAHAQFGTACGVGS